MVFNIVMYYNYVLVVVFVYVDGEQEGSKWGATQITVLMVIVVLATVVIIGGCIGIFLIKVYMNHRIRQYPVPADYLPSKQNLADTPLLTEEPRLGRVIGQGRFATVYFAQLEDQKEVAIKIFGESLQARQSWKKEKEVYSTPMLAHKNILRFHGFHKTHHLGRDSYWLLFDYYPMGSLYNYLQVNTITLQQFCVLAESATCGIAHLHSELISHDMTVKPAIAHRDLKSKNILVRSDLTCVISDFGLAIKFTPGETPMEIHGQVVCLFVCLFI